MPQTTTRHLQRAQNAAARLVTYTGSRDLIIPVLKDLHWLPVNHFIEYKLCLMMHQVHIQQWPDYLRDLVTSTATSAMRCGLCSASGLSCTENLLSAHSSVNAPSYSGPAAWNSLPLCLQSTTNTNSFKRQLNTHLFTKAF